MGDDCTLWVRNRMNMRERMRKHLLHHPKEFLFHCEINFIGFQDNNQIMKIDNGMQLSWCINKSKIKFLVANLVPTISILALYFPLAREYCLRDSN